VVGDLFVQVGLETLRGSLSLSLSPPPSLLPSPT
jgi:hypothetical protein